MFLKLPRSLCAYSDGSRGGEGGGEADRGERGERATAAPARWPVRPDRDRTGGDSWQNPMCVLAESIVHSSN